MQIRYWEYQIPVFPPYKIPHINFKLFEFTFIQICIILRMRMSLDKSTHI